MKRIIKRVFLFILVVLSLTIIYPINANALSQQTSYINIDDNTNSLIIGDLSFSNITFKDYSSMSTVSFGLTGVVTNSTNKNIDYISTAYYYDSNYNLIAQGYSSGIAIVGTSNFNQMSNMSILNGHSINEIYYYRLAINTTSSSSSESDTTPSKNNKYDFHSYVIDKYDINVIVNENNTLDITEKITAYFNVEKHGIFRTIPLKNTITRLDGTTSKNRTQITNLSVDNEYTTSRENGNYKIQIGSADHTVIGEQTYVIKYTYNLGKDPVKDYDELYYNIIGDEWDTVIGNITFTISMPKDFDSSKLGFSSGKTGSTDNSKIKYNVSENKITGSYNGILEVGEALTVRCELDEGYFVGAGIPINILNYFIYLLPIIFLGISALIWYKFGRDEQVVETVEFYPPEGFNSLEVGFLYKGKADNQDVTSLLIYLANKGYIKISETEEETSKSKGFKIIKLKEYDGNNINEQIFLKGLFDGKNNIDLDKIKKIMTESKQNGNKISYIQAFELAAKNEENKNFVTSDELKYNFYGYDYKILHNINNKENKNKIFEKITSSKYIIIILMIITTYFLITVSPVITYYDEIGAVFFGLFIIGCCNIVLFIDLFDNKKINYVNENNDSSILKKILNLVHSSIFYIILGIFWAVFYIPALLQEPLYLIGYIVGTVCALGMVICLKYLPKRTQYGNEILGKLRGFKNFLETAEKEKLEAMVMQDPTYFYNILPYTYVLGVSDKWIKKFETITLPAPSWYDSSHTFDMITFGTFMNTTMVSAQKDMSYSISSSNGGSSGGGSSGGGSGGGGGGSW